VTATVYCGKKVTLVELRIFSYLPRKMEPTLSSETSAYNIQTPGKFPEDESLLKNMCFPEILKYAII
jgi:hypothetical protein